MQAAAERIPVTVLTGFLGSGKTTLLNRALRETAGGRMGVVVNEFGPIGIDHDLIEAADEDVVLLAGGCACCVMRSDIGEALDRLARRRAATGGAPLERIVVETTGLADPRPIEQLFLAPGAVAHRYRLDAIVTTVDASLAVRTAGDPVWRRQAALADEIVVTKVDVAAPGDRAALGPLLDAVNRLAPRHGVAEGARLLAAAGRRAAAHATAPYQPAAVHDESVAAFAARFRAPLDGDVLAAWLDTLVERHAGRLLRVKGLVRLAGERRPLVVHAVQHLVAPPRLLDAWPGDDDATRIVFIARGLEPVDLLAGYAGDEAPQWT